MALDGAAPPRCGGPGLVDLVAPRGVRGLRPSPELQRPAGGLPGLRSPAPGRQAGRPRRLPRLRPHRRPYRGPPVQPDVLHPRRAGGRLGRRGVPASGDGSGRIRELHERAAHQPPPPAVRHRPDRQVVPQRDHARQLRLPHPRVRADGARVLRAAHRGRPVVPPLVRGADAVVSRPRHPRRPAAPAGPPGRRAEPLLLGHLRRGVPVPVGLGRTGGRRQPGELRPEPPRRMLRGADRIFRPGLRGPLRALRHRARGRGHSGGHGLSDRGLRHRAGRRRRAHRAAPRPPPGPLPGGGAAAVAQ